jgi:hypothetical protein
LVHRGVFAAQLPLVVQDPELSAGCRSAEACAFDIERAASPRAERTDTGAERG